MVGIIIPLKSKKVSEDWVMTASLLYQTILSILGQSSKQYKFIVVGHEKPNLPLDYPFIQCSLPIPKWEHVQEPVTHYKQIDYILDKTRKIVLGLQYLSQYPIDYFYVLDADDIIHESLVLYTIRTNHPNGYVLKSGYEYYLDSQKVLLRKDIEKRCGSTTIIHKSLVHIPDSIDSSEVWNHPWGQVSHGDMELHFKTMNTPLMEVWDPFLLYTLNHGQNASSEFRQGLVVRLKAYIKEFFFSKRISNSLKKSFSIN